MNHPQTLILYVENVAESADFYHRLFSIPVVEQSPNFAMLALPGGTMLGLWARHDVAPVPQTPAGGFELCVTVATDADTDAALAEARGQGLSVVQTPVRLDFGYTFLLKSPDGHLVRVFSPPAA
jgi:catechol 2,3-dioxygenase-like lactoylglutathione lyase family enzyme